MSGRSVRVENLENNNNPARKDEKRPKYGEKKIAKWPKSGEISLDLVRSWLDQAKSR